MVKNRELILIVDFGAGDSHLIARRVRSAHVFSEIMPYTAPAADMLDKKPKGIILCGAADDANVDAALRSAGIPLLTQVPDSDAALHTFLFDVCGCSANWNMRSFASEIIAEIQEQVGDKQVLLGLSGGVDSSVTAALIRAAVGDQLTAVFVNTGLMRKNEPQQVESVFRPMLGDKLLMIDAEDRFLDKLAGVEDPEAKRKIIGKEYIDVFAETARSLGQLDFLGQGTIYPDIVESNSASGAVIKSHHNVGGLPEDLPFCGLVEPLAALFKDEVRVLGTELGLPDSLVYRQPFPGPGLGVRCLGAITRDRLAALREADAIVREEFAAAGLEGKVWQYFALIPDVKSTGIRDNARSFDWPVVVRAVNTVDAMTASVEELEWPLLHRLADRIPAEVPGVNRVLYDLTPKPTGTIEWE